MQHVVGIWERTRMMTFAVRRIRVRQPNRSPAAARNLTRDVVALPGLMIFVTSFSIPAQEVSA